MELEPPNDFRCLKVYPTLEDIQKKSSSPTFLRKNKSHGSYKSVDEYLDIQFRLLREDFVKPLREAVNAFLSKTENSALQKQVESIFPCNVYISPLKREPKNSEPKVGDIESSMNTYVVCYTKDSLNSEILAIGRIATSSKIHQGTKTVYGIYSLLEGHYYAIEYIVNFGLYRAVLVALQKLSLEQCPLKKFIVDVCTTLDCPKYLRNMHQQFISEHKSELNNMQYEAYKTALNKEIVLINGPPGTGKTHLGLKIIKDILQYKKCSQTERNLTGPILVICNTNYVLDQFLERVWKLTNNIARFGGKYSSRILEEYMKMVYNGTGQDYMRLRNVDVVGMTASVAAHLHDKLEQIESPVLIVFEANEILESHVVVSLTKACQQLILIGDQQQRIKTMDSSIAKDMNLGISLFERLINNKFEYNTLNIQHRMRPEISSLICPAIYPTLENHHSVLNLPPIRGIAHSVFFINHSEPEKSDGKPLSIINLHEARYLIRLAQHLLYNGYKPKDITILVPYKKQYDAVMVEMQSLDNPIQCEVLDNYQGKENKIILLSLVRNNDENSIGFLKHKKSVCVALSRAKEGLYIMGNMELLCRNSKVWPKIRDALVRQNAIDESLTVYCETHKKKKKNRVKAKYPSDFSSPLYRCCKEAARNASIEIEEKAGHPTSSAWNRVKRSTLRLTKFVKNVTVKIIKL